MEAGQLNIARNKSKFGERVYRMHQDLVRSVPNYIISFFVNHKYTAETIIFELEVNPGYGRNLTMGKTSQLDDKN